MEEHSASVIIKAPIHQVYELFTHFNDFPKFMSFVKEVTYYDDQRSHWVVQVLRQYEWDAVNVDWLPDQQVGWRSTNGLKNSGKVKFRALGPSRTEVDVYIQYMPPTGPLGTLGERFGVNAYFEAVLQKDLDNFARMVEDAPAGALDPMSSHYLFHKESATGRGQITDRQKQAMAHDPMMSPQALAERQERIAQAEERKRQEERANAEARRQKEERERQITMERKAILAREEERRRQEQLAREAAIREAEKVPLDPRHSYAAWAHGLGDRDGLRARVPNYNQLSMTARRPAKIQAQASAKPPSAE